MKIENMFAGEENEEYYWFLMPQEEYLQYDDPDLYGESYNLGSNSYPTGQEKP